MSGALSGRTAIVYGAGGRLGPGVARGFAAAGAHVCLVGRRTEPLLEVKQSIRDAGGSAETAGLDVLDRDAVDQHVTDVARERGTVDVSFNLVARGDVHGTPLLEMATEDLLAPVADGLRGTFHTARAAAAQMARQGSGVILMISSGSGQIAKPSASFNMGGTGPADAAQESFMHYLAAEVGRSGVRVNCLWAPGVSYPEHMAGLSLLGRGPTPQQLSDTAVFLASDAGSGITASRVNVSSGVCGL